MVSQGETPGSFGVGVTQVTARREIGSGVRGFARAGRSGLVAVVLVDVDSADPDLADAVA